ncbi:hypothetical protein [Leifsonia sp. RAF41]|uniref:hypothetical protein n=1 Tax=Leifsonia sp. RAF41 TaxID=3233056 RepID=UPI003F98DD98
MRAYLRAFVLRWLLIVICVFPVGVAISNLRGYQYLDDPFGHVVAALVIVAASVADFLRSRQTSKKYNPEQSLRRARPQLPPRSQLDLTRPILGVYVRGELAGIHSLITVYQNDEAEWVGGYATLDGHFFPRLVDGLKDIPWADFGAELQEAGIWLLPQSGYSDNVAEIIFGDDSASSAPKGLITRWLTRK